MLLPLDAVSIYVHDPIGKAPITEVHFVRMQKLVGYFFFLDGERMSDYVTMSDQDLTEEIVRETVEVLAQAVAWKISAKCCYISDHSKMIERELVDKIRTT